MMRMETRGHGKRDWEGFGIGKCVKPRDAFDTSVGRLSSRPLSSGGDPRSKHAQWRVVGYGNWQATRFGFNCERGMKREHAPPGELKSSLCSPSREHGHILCARAITKQGRGNLSLSAGWAEQSSWDWDALLATPLNTVTTRNVRVQAQEDNTMSWDLNSWLGHDSLDKGGQVSSIVLLHPVTNDGHLVSVCIPAALWGNRQHFNDNYRNLVKDIVQILRLV
ncbi:hypothetical protein EGW08_015493 [Elysia chlorotica]|uniref:Uncharacterized protein n=1 Tax=Elysia chlorotica TaxID=188477 RepID=A0A433T5B8_ELYCH|nr:hypothetical protein EGW08_015493 [Elysia chlorotica]